MLLSHCKAKNRLEGIISLLENQILTIHRKSYKQKKKGKQTDMYAQLISTKENRRIHQKPGTLATYTGRVETGWQQWEDG